jgi:hypothetical protein
MKVRMRNLVRMVAGINFPNFPSIGYFIDIMRHEEPFVLFRIPGVEMWRFVVGRGLVSIECFERSKSSLYRGIEMRPDDFEGDLLGKTSICVIEEMSVFSNVFTLLFTSFSVGTFPLRRAVEIGSLRLSLGESPNVMTGIADEVPGIL